MAMRLGFVFWVAAVVLSLSAIVEGEPFAIDDEATCAADDETYFDSTSYLCVTCPKGEILGADNICRCPIGKLNVTPDELEPLVFTCEDTCAASLLATSVDSSQCLSCDAASGAVYDADTQDCSCLNGNSILSEVNSAGLFLGTKVCVTCPASAYVDQDEDPYSCISCPDPNMVSNGDGSCECDNSGADSWVQSGDVCLVEDQVNEILTTYSVDAASLITYRSVRATDTSSDSSTDVSSATYTNLFLTNAVQCKFYQIREACQTLLHLCLMQMYNEDLDPCSLYKEIENGVQTTEHEYREWKTSMPLLMFEDDRILRDNTIQQTVLFSPVSADEASGDRALVADILFWLATYTLEGEFLGYSQLDSQLMLCGEAPRKASSWLRFGTDYLNNCELDLASLLTEDQFFYELFFVDQDDLVVPVPVKILNFRDRGETPNVNSDGSEQLTQGNLALHRRFFLFDRVSGLASNGDANPEVLSYASSVVVRIQMQPDSETNIYPPFVSIRYKQRRVSALLEGGSKAVSRVEFRMEYFDEDDGLRDARTALFSLAIIAVFCVWMFKLYVYQRTNMLVAFDGAFALRALVFLGATLGEFFFWMLFILDFYSFCFFKGQQTVFFLLPVEGSDLYGEHRAIMIIAFIGKLFHVILKLVTQIYSDIFFVDWEMPKGRDSKEENVSVWRKLMVTNIWNDLQVYRIVDINFTILFMVFFLYGLELANASTKQPNLKDLTDTSSPVNEVLRFALSTLCWLILAGGQLVFQKFIYQRYMEHKSGQFVDLLNLTNISCFIFDERYRCYYLHGESMSKHADVSMDQINEVLRAYMNSATRSHGLESTGVDTWVVYTSRSLRRKYDDVYNAVVARKKNDANLQNRRAAMEGGGEGREMKGRNEFDTDKNLVNASNALNKFLKDFITRSNPDFPRQIDTRGKIANRFNIPPSNRAENEDVSLFFPDLNFNFTNVTLMGMEYELIVFYALFHGVCDLIWSNTFVSLFLVYLLDKAIVMVRRHWGGINLANKTLVDQRFLI